MMSPVALKDHLFANSGSPYLNELLFCTSNKKCAIIESIFLYSLHFF
jgi:hypothetical protein